MEWIDWGMDNIQKFTCSQSKFATEKKTIMICEDEPDVLLSFELILESKYNIIMVDSGQKCVEKYIAEISQGNKIHLVLLDYKLCGSVMGDSVVRKIKEYSETKVILISAYNIDDKLVNELKNGSYITKYVLKPIDSERLTNLIDEIIKN
jgi:response regulator RpfG family c-di-GMP phosphodiesterase